MKVEVERSEGGIARVWLNRPRALNAIDEAVLHALHGAFTELDGDDDVRAVVLGGRGGVFSAGLDVGWMGKASTEEVTRGLGVIHDVFVRIESCSKPVVAALDGPAIGGGLLLAMVADLRIASVRASVGVPEVRLGIFPSLSLIPRLERIVGSGVAKHLVLLGQTVDAHRALELRLVEEVVEGERFDRRVTEIAETLASFPPIGVREAKAAFAAARRSDYVEWEVRHFARCWDAPERAAAMAAFLSR